MLMTTDESFFTLMRGIKSILQVWVGSQIPDYNEAFALAVLAMLPPVLIVIVLYSSAGSSRASPRAINKETEMAAIEISQVCKDIMVAKNRSYVEQGFSLKKGWQTYGARCDNYIGFVLAIALHGVF